MLGGSVFHHFLRLFMAFSCGVCPRLGGGGVGGGDGGGFETVFS